MKYLKQNSPDFIVFICLMEFVLNIVLGFLSAAISGRPMMKFEGGYTVETVFDGSKLGIEPYSVEVLPSGELLVLDSANSNIYKISLPLSRCKYGLSSK